MGLHCSYSPLLSWTSGNWKVDFESTFHKDKYPVFVFELAKEKENLHFSHFLFFFYSVCNMISSCLHRHLINCIHSLNVWQTIRGPWMSIDVNVNRTKRALQLFNNLKRMLLKFLKESEPKQINQGKQKRKKREE